MIRRIFHVLCVSLLGISQLQASKLIDVLPIDNQCLVLHWQDGAVEYNWDDLTSGSQNGWDYYHTEKWSLCPDKDQYIPFGKPLDTAMAQTVTSFTIRSSFDDAYGSGGKHPEVVYRKSKVWEASHDERTPAMHHWVYLMLPTPLQRHKTYDIVINPETNSDKKRFRITFDEFNLESPSIKISNTGYEVDAPFKSADVYYWLGDGGERDFSRFTDTPWHLVEEKTGNIRYSGKLKFRMENIKEPKFQLDFTQSDIWECVFSDHQQPGMYRLVVEGIGSSAPFSIKEHQFEEPFRVAMQGMFYQRMGCDAEPFGGFPKARLPLYKQGSSDPVGFKVYISEKEMVTGTNPDHLPWYAEASTGVLAEATWGGWSDAYDNDQRPANFVCVFDLLMTYYLNPEAFSDRQLYIPEHGNGIPDLIDEALWEIDWWLRMRDPDGGYLTGLCNITPPQTINYAGAACAWQGWCVAAGCAMVSDCFRLDGKTSLQWKYADAALAAYEWALKQEDQMLDTNVVSLRGRDLKMTAAAFLFNLTGDKRFEDVVKAESVVTSENSKVWINRKWGQQYASLAYMLSPQTVSDPSLQARMKESIINQAKSDHMPGLQHSPIKAIRAAQSWDGMVQTCNEVSLVALAHFLTDNEQERIWFEKGLFAEAEWTLGRNPLGLVQMTGLGDRCLTQTFAPGRRDGAPGLTPGWTPYMSRDGWNNADDIHRCEWYTNRNYPTDKTVWPHGEHFWNSRYCVPNGETTPQQTFRQKILLYGYLYAISL